MEGRNIPLIIMLIAGTTVSIACILYHFSLFHTLFFVFITLVVFYVIGLVVKKIIADINKEAQQRASLLIQAEEEAQMQSAEKSEEEKTEDSMSEQRMEEDKDELTIN